MWTNNNRNNKNDAEKIVSNAAHFEYNCWNISVSIFHIVANFFCDYLWQFYEISQPNKNAFKSEQNHQ